MDIISDDKEMLRELIPEIIAQYKALGLTINEQRTQIYRIDKGFTWLQTKYRITETGRVIKCVPHDTVVRMRRKLKKLKKKVEAGVITYADVELMYKSWSGNIKTYNS